jgi:alanine racemase
MPRHAVATIYLQNLSHNLSRVRHFAPRNKIMAMVKANAYGHGLIEVARALQDADGFGVACISEAVRLRKAGITQPIFCASGFHDAADIPLLYHYQLTPVLHSMWQVNALVSHNCQQPLDIWLKYDTGMNRVGFSAALLVDAMAKMDGHAFITVDGVMSHLACAGEPDLAFSKEATESQIRTFVNQKAISHVQKSLANSAGIVAWPAAHEQTDWVRPGIMLYGASPVDNYAASFFGLKPVMDFFARVISVKKVDKGAYVGYGATFCAKKDMLVAVLSVGYGDGYPRDIKGAHVLIHQALCPVVGRVSMDMMSVDISMLESRVVPGDDALLWGCSHAVDLVAAETGCFYYQLLTQITDRVEKKYIV